MHVIRIPIIKNFGTTNVEPKHELDSHAMTLKDVIDLKEQTTGGYIYYNNSEIKFQLIRNQLWPTYYVLAVKPGKNFLISNLSMRQSRNNSLQLQMEEIPEVFIESASS